MAPTAGKNVTFEEGLRLQIRLLLDERDDMVEEIRQLRASVQIYAEIARRLEAQERAA
jgi:hypothetical protein